MPKGHARAPVHVEEDEEEEMRVDEDESSGDDDVENEDESSENIATESKSKKKKSKAPLEMSAKRPVGRFRKIIPTQKKSRDPRFESFTGRLNQDLFRKSYSFIDDVRQSELKQLREQLANERDEEKREVIRTALQLLQQQVSVQKKKDQESKLLAEVKHAEREKVAQGKKPFYMKESDKRKLLMLKKLEQLEAQGGLDKFMQKKLKRRAQKDHKRMPRARVERGDEGGHMKRQRRDEK